MIWNDTMLKNWAQYGGVAPYEPSLVNPASIDLRLGHNVRIPRQRWGMLWGEPIGRKTPADALWCDPAKFETFVLMPGQFALFHSLEYTSIPSTAAAQLFSKSSSGRIGLEHLHAGWADPGFHGQLVFEFKNTAPWPIELVAGQPYMQLVLCDMVNAPERDYTLTGRYNGQRGPEPARV